MQQREPLIRSRPAEDVIKLANALYQTYLKEDNPVLHIRKSRLCELFGWEQSEESDANIRALFDELNEPCALENFEYEGTLIPWQIVTFCTLLTPVTAETDYIDIEMNELFIAALQSNEEMSLIDFSQIPK